MELVISRMEGKLLIFSRILSSHKSLSLQPVLSLPRGMPVTRYIKYTKFFKSKVWLSVNSFRHILEFLHMHQIQKAWGGDDQQSAAARALFFFNDKHFYHHVSNSMVILTQNIAILDNIVGNYIYDILLSTRKGKVQQQLNSDVGVFLIAYNANIS